MAAAGAALALVVALAGARALRPPGHFTKYLDAAGLSPAQLRERGGDYSPLYLALARRVVPRWGSGGLLAVNVVAHAVAAAAVAAGVALAAGWGWGLAAGAVAASYRPFLVYVAVLEPEAVLLALLAVGLLAGVAAQRGGRGGPLAAVAAGAALGGAALARPVWAALLPLWTLWLASPREGRWRTRMGAAVLAGVAAVAVPLAVAWVGGGRAIPMNPGPVLYEGNGPQATGAPGVQPELVKILEANRGEGGDWAHVAYRELAAVAMGRGVTPAEANGFWLRLTWEYLWQRPGVAGRRLLDKAACAVGAFEFHDLPEAEELDRRLRRVLPWGFGVLLPVAVAALPAARRGGGAWGGPAAVAALALAVQVAFYASARQRLPLALGALVLGFLGLPRLRALDRRRVGLAWAAGLALAAAASWWAAPLASFRDAQLSALLGPAPPASAARWLDGRAWRPGVAAAAARVVLGAEVAGAPWEVAAVRGFLAPALGSPVPWLRGRARLQVALHAARAGAAAEAVAHACQAAEEAPGLVGALALCAVGRGDLGAGQPWRPPGVDPASAGLALARALRALGREDAAQEVLEPWLEAVPELARALEGG